MKTNLVPAVDLQTLLCWADAMKDMVTACQKLDEMDWSSGCCIDASKNGMLLDEARWAAHRALKKLKGSEK